MKVLIVCPRMDLYGGAELLVVRLSSHLACNNIQHALLTTHLSSDIAQDLKGTEIINLTYRRLKGALKPLNLLLQLMALNKGIRKHYHKFDVINVHNYPAEIAVFPIRRPVVWMCNEPPEVHVRFQDEKKYSLRWFVVKAILSFDRWMVRHWINQTVVADTFNQMRFKEKYGRHAQIIHYGIDTEYFGPKGHTAAARPNPKRFTVLHVGMLTPEKNQLESIRTVAELKSHIPQIELILAGFGQGAYLQHLQNYISENGLKQHVTITGHLNREQIRQLYYAAQVLIHPIRPQGGWLSPFEALCTGLPIVVSPAMTAAEIIQSNDLGIVTEDYASALLDVYQKPFKYSKAAKRRSDWVRNNLSWDEFGNNMLQVFASSIIR